MGQKKSERRAPFATAGAAVRYARKNRWKITEQVSHTGGMRINVVSRTGKPRTLRVKS